MSEVIPAWFQDWMLQTCCMSLSSAVLHRTVFSFTMHPRCEPCWTPLGLQGAT